MGLIRYIRNTRYLKSLGWYKNMAGNWIDSHAMNCITSRQLYSINIKKLKEIIDYE